MTRLSLKSRKLTKPRGSEAAASSPCYTSQAEMHSATRPSFTCHFFHIFRPENARVFAFIFAASTRFKRRQAPANDAPSITSKIYGTSLMTRERYTPNNCVRERQRNVSVARRVSRSACVCVRYAKVLEEKRCMRRIMKVLLTKHVRVKRGYTYRQFDTFNLLLIIYQKISVYNFIQKLMMFFIVYETIQCKHCKVYAM